jgi:hypothetical protein
VDKRKLIVGLVWDVGVPALVFYVLDAFGVDTMLALAAGGAAALIRVAVVAVVHRRLDGLAAIVSASFVLLLTVSLLIGDPRIMLARESLLSGFLGLLLVGSCVIGRPMLYALVRRANSGNGRALAQWDELWRTQPGFRRRFTMPSLVIGGVLLAESTSRIVLIFLLPVEVMAGVSTGLHLGAIAILVAWGMWFRNRRRRSLTAAGQLVSSAGSAEPRAR